MELLQRVVLNGGIMMWLLVPSSVIAAAYVVQGMISLRRERIVPKRLRLLAEGVRESEDVEAVRRRLATERSPLGRVASGLGRAQVETTAELEREADRLASEEMAMLYHKRVGPLALLRNVALYLGLLGTIFGIMQAFGEFSQGDQRSVEKLGQGINQALVTTAWGLSIAIPCMVFVHLFRQRLITFEKAVLPEAALAIHRRASAPQPAAESPRRSAQA